MTVSKRPMVAVKPGLPNARLLCGNNALPPKNKPKCTTSANIDIPHTKVNDDFSKSIPASSGGTAAITNP